MSGALRQLARWALSDLADALASGALDAPFSALGVRRFALPADRQPLADELQRLHDKGMTAAHLAEVVRAVLTERDAASEEAVEVELVWTGPEAPGAASRDTLVVVTELFERARRSVLVAGYSVYDGRSVFRKLIQRMATDPALRVRMFLNIERKDWQRDLDARAVVEHYASHFLKYHWEGSRAPEVFYDPRSLLPEPEAVLHAKCVIVDDELAFVTSANLTEAAQQRNLEAGVLVKSRALATQLRAQFEGLVAAEVLRRVPGIE
jgi:phosphatidylserine/phosphatidylglycerophosphate/cardiolipin synthase-like enzyme